MKRYTLDVWIGDAAPLDHVKALDALTNAIGSLPLSSPRVELRIEDDE